MTKKDSLKWKNILNTFILYSSMLHYYYDIILIIIYYKQNIVDLITFLKPFLKFRYLLLKVPRIMQQYFFQSESSMDSFKKIKCFYGIIISTFNTNTMWHPLKIYFNF